MKAEKNAIPAPKLIIDKSLNENSEKVLFPKKVEKMMQLLRNVPPPKILQK